MFFIFGSGSKQRMLGHTEQRHCPHCNNTKRWDVIRQHRYVSLFFIPVAQWNKEYFAICPICSFAEAFDARADAEAAIA